MADEVQMQFHLDQPPEQALAAWKARPPRAFDGFDIVDESYASLDFEQVYYDWPAKLLFVTTFGFGLLFKGFMESQFKLTARFDPDGTGSRVTLVGKAHPRSRPALAELATSR